MQQGLLKKKSNLPFSVESFIKAKGLFEPGNRIMVGVSGGPDSMALFSLLLELRSRWDLNLMVLHCHHGLRMEADEEEALVRAWAKKGECPFFRRKLPVLEFQKKSKMSLEEAARELRYRTFLDYAKDKKADRVALAHTANDQAEEVLIGLIRGAGLGGLAGIPIKRGPFIRPLIRIYRSEILDYLRSRNVPFAEDLSNQDFRYLRARVRHHLIPELTKYSPNIIVQLNQTAGLLQKDDEFIQGKVDEIADSIISRSGDSISLLRSRLAELPQALGSRLIQEAVFKGTGSLRHLRAVHILSVLAAAHGDRIRGRIPLPEGWGVLWDHDTFKLSQTVALPGPGKPFAYEIRRPKAVVIQETGEKLFFRKIKVPLQFPWVEKDRDTVRVDYDKLVWPLLIRNLKAGDRFQPLGMKGSKKVSRFFIDRKIPKTARPHIPLILSGENIVWIAGMEIGQAFALDSQSSRALEMKYLSQESEHSGIQESEVRIQNGGEAGE